MAAPPSPVMASQDSRPGSSVDAASVGPTQPQSSQGGSAQQGRKGKATHESDPQGKRHAVTPNAECHRGSASVQEVKAAFDAQERLLKELPPRSKQRKELKKNLAESKRAFVELHCKLPEDKKLDAQPTDHRLREKHAPPKRSGMRVPEECIQPGL